MGAFGKNSSAKTLIILKIIFFIIILDKNKPILIIGSLFLDKKGEKNTKISENIINNIFSIDITNKTFFNLI